MKKILLFILLSFCIIIRTSALTCNENEFIVNYNANKGKIKLTSECVSETLTDIKPTRSGYTFLGWSESKTASIPTYNAGDEIELNNNITLYAVWSKGYKLSFNGNGGKSSKKYKTVYKYLSYGTLPTASRKGYLFLGWFTKKSGGTLINSSDVVDKSKSFTLYAHYQKIIYDINYELNGGVNSSKNKTSYYVTTSTFSLYSPSKKGYSFGGWYSTNKYKTKVTKIKKGSTGNKTYYAKWTPITYNISFNGNGNSSGKMTNQSNLKYDTSYTLKANTYVKIGYVFAGWNTKKDGSGIQYNDKSLVVNLLSSNKKTIILYAQWKKPEYKINYELNDGLFESDVLDKYTSEYEFELPIPKRDGYSFDGWYLDSDFVNRVTKIEKGSTGIKTLYAKWNRIEEELTIYTITYELNGGVNNENAVYTFNKNDEVILLNPSRDFHSFIGWYTEAEFENKITKIEKETTHNIIVYAKWELSEEVETYDIIYHLNEGTNPKTAPTKYSSLYAVELPLPNRKGWTFDGWYLENTFETKVSTIAINSTGDKEFYAKWIKNEEIPEEYNIIYELNDGDELENPIVKFTKEDEFVLPIPTKHNCTFDGWYTEVEFENKITKIEKGTTEDLYLYAKWIENEIEVGTYNINYILNGGTNPNDAVDTYTKEDEVLLPIPTRVRSEFIGWYTDSEYTNKITKINKGSKTNYNLYAKWNFDTKRKYNYLYYTNSSNYIIKNQNDILKSLYNGLNDGSNTFTLTCDYDTVENCFSDFNVVIGNRQLLSSINNYVHPYNKYYSMSYSQISNGIDGTIKLTINKKYNDEQITEIDSIIDSKLNELNLDEMSDRDKIKWAHDYLVNKNSYDEEAASTGQGNAYSAYGAIVEDKAVCQGYTEAMALFLDRFNIPNIMVASNKHIWNLVYVDKEWLHLDATWDDPVYSDHHQGLVYDYYLITSTELVMKDNNDNHVYNTNYYIETSMN